MAATDIWGPLGAILGLVGIVIGGVLAWWFARGPRLVMQASGSTLVSTPSDQRIKVLYEGEQVPRVTQSLVWLWREGRGTIRGSDVVTADPITIRVPPGDRILDAAILAQSKPTNAVNVQLDVDGPEAGARLAFEYLDPRQGAVIEVLHTAESPESVELIGTIMGVPKGIVRVRQGVEVDIPVGIAGAVSVTVPTHTIPRSLRRASGARTSREVDVSLVGTIANLIRVLLP
jgi:hypothetical protein